MGNVQIELESSTNLLTWAAATNGVYNDDQKFFRVKLTKLPKSSLIIDIKRRITSAACL